MPGVHTMSSSLFLVVYDYRTGGLWALVNASSPEEISEKAPQLKVISSRPGWMNDEAFEQIARDNTFDIDDIPPLWARLLAEKTE